MNIRIKIIASEAAKYVKGFVIGAAVIIALNSHDIILRMEKAPVLTSENSAGMTLPIGNGK